MIRDVVAAAEWAGRRHPIGKAQEWYYPADGTLVIWETFLEELYLTYLLSLVIPS